MGKQEFPFVTHFRDRHGKLRWRFRKDGFTVALGTDYGGPEFLRKLSAAQKGERLLTAEATRSVLSGSVPGSLSEVVRGWYQSPDFKRLSSLTRYGYRRIADRLVELHGKKNVKNLQRRHIKDLMAEKADTPTAANHILRILHLVLDHAVDTEVIAANPSRGVKKYAVQGDGYHTWTEAEIAKYYLVHGPGTTAHLAMTLMLYTGAARGDAVLIGPASVVDGRLRYRRKKMQTRAGVLIDIPVHPVLQAAIDTLPDGLTTFLQTQAGGTRSSGGLGNLMQTWCSAAGIPECSAHGLRKACARRLIEAGATPHEMMAVTGHKTLAEAQRYAATFERSTAADKAMDRLPRG